MTTDTTTELESEEEVTEISAPALTAEEEVLFSDMIKAGVIYGCKKSKTNPKMGKYIFATRKGIEIFDLSQTLNLLDKAIVFLKEKMEKKLSILVVGTQPAAKELVKNFADKFGFTYVVERWLGGTMTNFKVISKRIEYFIRLKSDKATGRLDKYTKRERLKLDETIQKLSRVLSGIEKMNQLPEAIIIFDIEEHDTAVREAKRLKIPIIGIGNSDSNPDGIDYLIPANDNSKASIAWILEYIEKKLS